MTTFARFVRHTCTAPFPHGVWVTEVAGEYELPMEESSTKHLHAQRYRIPPPHPTWWFMHDKRDKWPWVDAPK